MEPILLPIPEACRVIGIGRSKLYELIAEGKIGTRKIGHKTLVPREELVAFVEQLVGTAEPTAA